MLKLFRATLPLAALAALLLAGLALLQRGPLSAQGTAVPAVPPAVRHDPAPLDRAAGPPVSSYADVLDRAIPAVVAVYPARIERSNRFSRRGPMSLEDLLRRYYGLPDANPALGGGTQERLTPIGMGSGVIVSPDGYILTNNHVVSDENGRRADDITVRLNDGRQLKAQLVGADPRSDVAVLKVEAEDLPHAVTADSDQLRVGDVAFAIGNPLEVGLTVTMGIVSATGRTGLGILGQAGYENFIQTDASINPGNSGGALVDAEGRLIGINTAILSRTGGNIGIGFAIPINQARAILDSLVETGTIQRGFLGVAIADLTPDMAEASGLPNARGAHITGVQPGLPADRAGLRPGDVVTAIDGKAVASSADFRLQIAGSKPGTTVKLEVRRAGESREVEVVLGDMDNPNAVAGSGPAARGEGRLLEGVRAAPLSPDLRQTYSLPDEVQSGLVVTAVEGNSPYRLLMEPGLVVVEINDRPVRDLAGSAGLLRRGANKLYVWQEGAFGFLAVRVP